MKVLASALAALCLAACGAPIAESPSSSSEFADATLESSSSLSTAIGAEFVKVLATDLTLEGVKTRRENGRKVTDVTLGVMMGCLDKLADIGTFVERKGTAAKLHVSAHVLVHKNSDRVRCARASYAKHVVKLSGTVRKENVELLALEDLGETAIQEGDVALGKISSARVTHAAMICPPNPSGISCRAVGSRVQLEVLLGGCADRLGPVASHFELARDGKVDLFVKMLNVTNELSTRINCFAAARAQVDLVTGLNVLRPSQLRVHVLQ